MNKDLIVPAIVVSSVIGLCRMAYPPVGAHFVAIVWNH